MEHDAAESLPALDFFAGKASQSGFACSEGSGRVCSVLFIGDSFTHGRYTPVRNYNSQTPGEPWQPPQVIDENYGQTGEREESPTEPGPWGGIPFSRATRASASTNRIGFVPVRLPVESHIHPLARGLRSATSGT